MDASAITRAKIGAAIGLVALSTACGFKVEKEGSDSGNAADTASLTANSSQVLGYNSLKTAIFDSKCISCHGNSGGVNLETYSSAVAAVSRIQAAVLQNQTMPPSGPLSSAERQAIQAWIDAGAPEQDVTRTSSPAPSESATPEPTVAPSPSPTVTLLPSPTPSQSQSPSPSPSTGAITYAQVQAQVFAPSCVSCHGTSGGVNLSTYANVIKNLSAVQSEALTRQSMPPSQPLSSQTRALLQAWIDQGAPQ